MVKCPRCGREARKRDPGECYISGYMARLPDAYLCQGAFETGSCCTIFDKSGKILMFTIMGAEKSKTSGFILPLTEPRMER